MSLPQLRLPYTPSVPGRRPPRELPGELRLEVDVVADAPRRTQAPTDDKRGVDRRGDAFPSEQDVDWRDQPDEPQSNEKRQCRRLSLEPGKVEQPFENRPEKRQGEEDAGVELVGPREPRRAPDSPADSPADKVPFPEPFTLSDL